MEKLSKRDLGKRANEKRILDAAEKVFCEKGYDDAGMDEIAKEAQFTKRTIYQHYDNKDDLYFAVALKGYKKLSSKITEANRKEPSGYDKLERSCRIYYKFYMDNPDFIRLFNYWGTVQQKSPADSRNKNALIEFHHTMVRNIADILEEGREDGSIQLGLDAEKTALCLMFIITGFYNQLSTTGANFSEHFLKGQEELSECAIGLFIKPLKRIKTIMTTRKGTV